MINLDDIDKVIMPGILGELLSAALNVNAMLWKTCPAATELEQVTLDWLRQLAGLPKSFWGIIYDTASVSTLHAIAAAREGHIKRMWDIVQDKLPEVLSEWMEFEVV